MAASDDLFDPRSAEFIADPYPTYRRLRAQDGPHWFEPLDSWLVSTYADCQAVLRDTAAFRSPPNLTGIQALDPPQSLPYRSLIRSGLRAAQSPEFEADLVRAGAQLLRAARAGGPFDLVRDFVTPFCLAAVSRLVAVPVPDGGVFEEYTTAHQRAMDSQVVDPAEREAVAARAARSRARIAELIDRWSAGGAPGILTHLQQGGGALGITAKAERATVYFVVFSTYGTGTAALGNGLAALLRRPGGLKELRALGPAGWDRATDELLRYDPPVQVLARTCTADTELGGRTIRQGQGVLALAGSANHDPEQFADPEEVVLTREHNPHFGLGWGAHVCLGAPLTQLMFRAAFRALLDEAPGLALVGEPVRRPISTSRAFEAIPVDC
ncbi:cytochrome P450 [Kitasatospora viridis]|uniref:Unspecific monooxygenase n=1 Tax=Kitasatospora viridis TaxID=281105 RepID=A0A561UBM0_9ACTN|nr:cytochrome P450 [Kitasatospora viridis]TWF96746.1 unspecific monooxygenase [Kitasatospora viridis]